MLIAFLAFIAMVDYLLGLVSPGLSLARIFAVVFAPVAVLMGVPPQDVPAMGDLLGTKLVANEFVAYVKLTTQYRGVISPRAYVLATYALTGFANFASIGIQLGGIGGMAPLAARRSRAARRARAAGRVSGDPDQCLDGGGAAVSGDREMTAHAAGDERRRVDEAADAIRARAGTAPPDAAIVLGSGLGDFARQLGDPVAIPYGDLPHWPASAVVGHDGRLVVGTARRPPRGGARRGARISTRGTTSGPSRLPRALSGGSALGS